MFMIIMNNTVICIVNLATRLLVSMDYVLEIVQYLLQHLVAIIVNLNITYDVLVYSGNLSPILFNVYMDDLSVSLNSSNIVGRIGNIFLNHLCYADKLCLIRLSSVGMQKLLGICSKYAIDHSYTMTKKLFSLCFIPGTLKFGRPALYIMDDLQIPNVSERKYLGTIICQKNCDLDIKRQMRKFMLILINMLLRRFSKCSTLVKCYLLF